LSTAAALQSSLPLRLLSVDFCSISFKGFLASNFFTFFIGIKPVSPFLFFTSIHSGSSSLKNYRFNFYNSKNFFII